jgi:lysophospholipase L1-like esterase
MSISLKIVALGTSLTATPGWVADVGTRVEQCTQRDVQTKVFAKGGATSRWGLSQIEQVAASKPDAILIEFAASDSNLRRLVSLAESHSNHQKLIQDLRQAQPNIRIFLIAVVPTWGLRGSWIRPWISRYYELYPALAESEHVGFVDARPQWRLSHLHDDVPDGVHPTQKAMLDNVAPIVAGSVCNALTGRSN